MKRFWVLGASDKEMETIEGLLRKHGQEFTYATRGGRRVFPSEAYQADPVRGDWVDSCVVTFVECDSIPPTTGVFRVDHHRPGDPGFSQPPNRYWEASSLGQVCFILGEPPTRELRLVAAADHCLEAAYRGRCPGVDPDELMRARVSWRASFQGRPEVEVLRDVEAAREALRRAPRIVIGGVGVADLRDRVVPELPEAAARDGIPFISIVPDRSGRRKIVLQAAPREAVLAFTSLWAPAEGVVDVYGDPERGFAGGFF